MTTFSALIIAAFVVLWLSAGGSVVFLGMTLTDHPWAIDLPPLWRRRLWSGLAVILICWTWMVVFWPMYVSVFYAHRFYKKD